MTLIKNIKNVTMVQAAEMAKKSLVAQIKKEVKSLRAAAADPEARSWTVNLNIPQANALEGFISKSKVEIFDFSPEIKDMQDAINAARQHVFDEIANGENKISELCEQLKGITGEEYALLKKQLEETRREVSRMGRNIGEFVKEEYEKALFLALGKIKGESNQIRFLKKIEGKNMRGTDVPAGNSFLYPAWDEGHGDWTEELTFGRQWPIVPTKNKVVAFHGIHFVTGGPGKKTMKELKKRADGVVGQFDTCVADIALGSIGFIVKGGIRVAFANDSWSGAIMKKGPRNTSNVYSWTDHMEDPKQGQFSDLAYYSRNEEGEYAEGWMLPEEIVGVFLQQSYSHNKEWVAIAKALAKQHGVKIYIVDEDSRICNMGIIEGYYPMDEHNEELNDRDFSDVPDNVIWGTRKVPSRR